VSQAAAIATLKTVFMDNENIAIPFADPTVKCAFRIAALLRPLK
jgi:hypothetical protein